jgi:hypothetical protein
MTQRAEITDVQLSSWRATGYPYKVIAAEIATWTADHERGTALPDDSEFGRDLDFVASPKTYQRAKRFLLVQGVLEISDGPYYVA